MKNLYNLCKIAYETKNGLAKILKKIIKKAPTQIHLIFKIGIFVYTINLTIIAWEIIISIHF